MPRHLPQPHPDSPLGDRLGGLIGRVRGALAGRNGQTLPDTPDATPHQPCVAMPARPAEAQGLISATIDENRNLTAHVRELEAELRSSSAEVAKLRGQLRGAVQDALTDSLTRLANRRSFDLECAAVVARASKWSPAHLGMADIDHFVVCAAIPTPSSGSRFRSGWPVGMRAKAVPEWYARAHAALYEAKRRGRNRWRSIPAGRPLPKLGSSPPERRCDGSLAPAMPSNRVAGSVADAD